MKISSRLFAASVLTITGTLICLPAFSKAKTVKVTVRVDSEEPGYEGFRAMDGNPQTR